MQTITPEIVSALVKYGSKTLTLDDLAILIQEEAKKQNEEGAGGTVGGWGYATTTTYSWGSATGKLSSGEGEEESEDGMPSSSENKKNPAGNNIGEIISVPAELLSKSMIKVMARKIQHILKVNMASVKKHALRSGKLTANRLYKVEMDNSKVFNKTKVNKASKYTFGLMMDISGSMLQGEGIHNAMLAGMSGEEVTRKCLSLDCRMKAARDAMVNTAIALTSLPGVEVDLLTHDDRLKALSKESKKTWRGNTASKIDEDIMYNILHGTGGNHMGDCISEAIDRFPPTGENILFVYSDGEDDPDLIQQAIEKGKKKGVQVAMFGIQSPSVQKFKTSVNVNNLNELYPETIKLLTKMIK